MTRHPDSRLMDRLQALGTTFRPAVPIDHKDLFAGRIHQLAHLVTVIGQAGRHAVIFGERGVGKTSLAAVSAELTPFLSVKVNADPSDNFHSIWTKVIDEFTALSFSGRWRWGEKGKTTLQQAIELLSFDDHSPDRVRHFLRILSELASVVVYIDEFDRISDPGTPILMADTIKMLADNAVEATLVVVGVADDVDSLISQHSSIERALAQIAMPRMSAGEIADIYRTGFARVDIRPDVDATSLLVSLPQGLPHFAHMLGQEAARPVIMEGTDTLNVDQVRMAVTTSCSSSDASMVRTYVDATTSSHKTLFKDVLLACALTDTDELGFFSPINVRPTLERILGQALDQARYARHLVQFCNERGPLLERRGGEHRWRYRFINPMMRPYIVMRAYSEGVSEDVLQLSSYDPNEHGQLF